MKEHGSSQVYNSEAGITSLCCHAFLKQFPRLCLLVINLDAAQQCIAVIPATTHNTTTCQVPSGLANSYSCRLTYYRGKG